MSDEVVARLQRVTKKYAAIDALTELSLDLRAGELLALLGPNGAGKTSAVRLLLGLSSPTSGGVSVFGGDPRERKFRTRTGVMLQVGRVPETMRVREHIELFSSYYPQPRALNDVLAAAGLVRLSNRYFKELSGGEQQRVLFALAICGDPELLVLDEPTVGLDVESRRAMWEEIQRLIESGRSVLLTTHYLAEADELANRVIVLNHGRIIAEGTPAEIKRTTGTRKVSFRSDAPEPLVMSLPGAIAVTRSADRYDVSTSDGEHFTRALFQRVLDVRELEISASALEDAFVALTSDHGTEKVA